MRAIILSDDQELSIRLRGCLAEASIQSGAVVGSIGEAETLLTGDTEFLIFWHCRFAGDPETLRAALAEREAPAAWVVMADRQADVPVRQVIALKAAAVILAGDTDESITKAIDAAASALRDAHYMRLILDAFHQQRYALVGQCMRGLLSHLRNEKDQVYMEKLGMVPQMGKPGWLVLMHVINRTENADDVPRTLISMYTSQTAERIFDPLNEMQAVTWMSNDTFAVFLQNRGVVEPGWPEIQEKLADLKDDIAAQYGWRVSMYVSGPIPMSDAPGRWPELLRVMRDNVMMKPVVSHLSELIPDGTAGRPVEMNDLRRLLGRGEFSLALEEADNALKKTVEKGGANRAALRAFYQQMMQAVHSVMWEKGWNAESLFSTEDEQAQAQTAVDSVDNMRSVTRFVMDRLRKLSGATTRESAVQIVCRYISDHIQDPLRREELSAYVHLNPDYLSRIFRRQTGMSIKDYIIRTRMEAARRLLTGTQMRVGEIAEAVGYSNYSYFTQNYRETFGKTPIQERGTRKP